MTNPSSKRRLRKVALAAAVAVIVAAAAVPLVRSVEHAPLDATARKQAPGKFLSLSHGMVHYRIAGPEQGQPVVLVHGFSVPDYVWDGTRDALAGAGYRVVSFDLYGRGWSDRPDTVYDRDLFATQVREVMDALHMPKAHVVGLSMGGAIVGHFAAQHPERVRSMVLIAPLTLPRDISVLAWPGVGEYVFRSQILPSMPKNQDEDFPHPIPGWAQKFAPQMQYEGFGRAILSTVRSVITRSSVPDFEKVGRSGLPVGLIWGERDVTVPYAQHADVQRAIPQAKFVSLPGLGHLTVVEDPATTHAQLVDFLRQH